ncbi:MAG: hypothetical protein MUO31_00890 [Thermodesulfovibrionales bacterium]|nr:hypothetical protein [Thermodesulfovibrionales bacterium]
MTKWHPKRPDMKNMTTNVPMIYLDLIGQICDLGLAPSRSEWVRMAIYEKFSRDIGLMRSLIDEALELPEKREVFEYPETFVIKEKVWQKQ